MKVRDLQQSFLFRESVKLWGEPHTRHRVIIAPPMFGMTAKVTNTIESDTLTKTKTKETAQNSSTQVSHALYNIDREIEKKQKKYDELREWVNERKSLRNDLDGMGLDIGWLKSKNDKSLCEERVLEMMQEKQRAETIDRRLPNKLKEAKVTNAQVQMIPSLDTPLPIGLAMIAEYLQSSRIRLLDLFQSMDKNKDWNTTRGELKKTLQATGIPLTETMLEELIITLDVNGDNQLSYRELARGIEAYHKDQRWQKVKALYDSMSDDPDFFKEKNRRTPSPNPDFLSRLSSPSPPPREANQMITLSLPKVENSKISETDMRLRKKEEMKERIRSRVRRKTDKRSKDNEIPVNTTITGAISELKKQYLNFINQECKRCIDLLKEAGIPVSSNSVKRALIPPPEYRTCHCVNHLRHERCLFALTHPKTSGPRKRRQQRLKKMGQRNTSPTSTCKTKQCLLPRVATIDHRNRAKEGRIRRNELSNGEPSPYWTDGTLGKEVMCPDSGIEGFGRKAMFNRVDATYNYYREYTEELDKNLKELLITDHK